MKEKAVFKRVDLAVNDLVGMLDIPLLISKCRKEECVSVFRSFRAFRSGGLVSRQEQDSAHMGATLYIGSMQSDLYFLPLRESLRAACEKRYAAGTGGHSEPL